ncbi:MAG: ribonuclease catalytic domain-containing protein, partial [Desulfomonile sp.]|nr:ribonuclease catalytic domain-containing protein [Desulfomonile sp.]
MGPQKHDVVDYYDEKRIMCGLVLDFEDGRLRILSEQGKETKLSLGRVLIAEKDPAFPLSAGRDIQVERLREISRLREEIKSGIDLSELWEVVGLETEAINIHDLADLFFGNKKDFNSSAALLRAISEDRLYFKIRPEIIEVTRSDRVEQALLQRERERVKRTFLADCAAFLSRVGSREQVSAEEAPEGLIALLEEAALYGKDWTTFKRAKEMFAHPGVPVGLDPFRILLRLGLWSEDENIRLRAEKVPVEFPPEAEAEALTCASKPLPNSGEDLTGERAIAIDSESTRDVDDAISVSYEGPDVLLGIHITDVAHFVDHASPLDAVIRERATTIYLPDLTVPMIPPALSECAASLAVGQVRPAISVIVRFNTANEIKDYRIVRSLIRVAERLSYEAADERIADVASTEARMFAIASHLRSERVAAGAVIFRDPELSVHIAEDGSIEVSLRDRETPSQVLVSEMMILANSLFARFLKEHDVPAIFRSQPPPAERIDPGEVFDPVMSYRCRRAMARGDIGLDPAPHSTLALDCYTTATSPLRRYPDLLVQRQLKAFFETGRPLLTRDELEKILVEISYPLERAVVLERERERYFLLKFLSRQKDRTFEAVVLNRFPKFYLVHLYEFGTSAALVAS